METPGHSGASLLGVSFDSTEFSYLPVTQGRLSGMGTSSKQYSSVIWGELCKAVVFV